MKKIQNIGEGVVRSGVEGVNKLRGEFNTSGITPDEALALGIALGAGGASSVVGGLVDMGTGEERGFGEAPRNIVGGTLGTVGGAFIGGGIPAVAAALRNNSISPQAARRQMLRGGAVGAGLGGFSAGSIMVSNDRPAAAPDDQRSIAGSLNEIDRDDIIALLNANGVI